MNTSYNDDIRQAVDVLRRGGVIIYPTDTVWGIGCDATNDVAVMRIFDIKHRPDSKALITLVDSIPALERIIPDIPEVAYQLLDVAVDPITIVYDHAVGVSSHLLAPDGSIGVRVVADDFASQLCRMLRRPIVSTSVNISGAPAPRDFTEIDPALLDAVDYICTSKRDVPWAAKASSVIKISEGGLFKILRK